MICTLQCRNRQVLLPIILYVGAVFTVTLMSQVALGLRIWALNAAVYIVVESCGPAANSACFNGGTCTERGNKVTCTCHPAYEGPRCVIGETADTISTDQSLSRPTMPQYMFYSVSVIKLWLGLVRAEGTIF